MDLQEMRGLVRDVVWYETHYGDEADSYAAEGLTVDIDATVEAVFEKLLNDGTYNEVQGMERWLYEETVHLAALDYFSSWEPVLIRMEAANA